MKNKVLVAKKEFDLGHGMIIKKGQELEVVEGMVYVNGLPVMGGLQKVFMEFIKNNEKDFKDDTRNW